MSDGGTRPGPFMRWYRPMVRRSPEEAHPVSPLELLFDLCFVVAVRRTADRLHDNLGETDILHGIGIYPAVFFAIWWAWMSFTTFASAYDPDDDVYRITTLVQIAGGLVLAGGVPRAFDRGDFSVITYGYVIMRLAMVGQWLRAAYSDPQGRATALRYAVGISLLQAGWLARLAAPDRWLLLSFVVLVAAELLLPFWARRPKPITWHPQHITERFGLFTIIVLGESLLSASLAVQRAFDEGQAAGTLMSIAGFSVVIIFAMWWLYFDRPAYHLLTSPWIALFWGYGQYLIISSAAALGPSLAINVDWRTGAATLDRQAVGYATAAPVAIYLLAVWALHIRPYQRRLADVAYGVVAVLVLLTPFTPGPIPLTGALLAGLVAVTVIDSRRAPDARQPPPTVRRQPEP